jgi:4-hydroxymandelate oxidase
VLFMVSTASSYTLEEIAEVAGGARWFQLYFMADRGVTLDLIERAARAGYGAVVVTIDAPVAGPRRRTGPRSPETLAETFANLRGYPQLDLENLSGATAVAGLFEQRLNWDDIAWLVTESALPVLVKGILSPAAARRALDAGVAGLIVSNHGGRQLDHVPATIDALPGVVGATNDQVPVLVDGGVQDGSDALIALARGATAAGIGRPVLWALATGGQAGVEQYLRAVIEDLRVTMTLAGIDRPQQAPSLSPDAG